MRRIEQVVAAIEANHFATLREFVQGEHAEILINAEMMRAASGVAYPLFNFVARPRFESRVADHRIESFLDYFRQRRLPFLVYIHPSSTPVDLPHRLERHGLHHWGFQDGMALTHLNSDVRTQHEVQVEVARDVASLTQAAEVYAEAFHLPPEAALHMRAVMLAAQYDPGVSVYLARLHGMAVGTLFMTLKAGVAGLYGLGTRPECRGRGVGTTLMVRAIFDANALGYSLVVLQAPRGALTLYRRLGFETYLRVDIYAGN